MNLPFHTVPGHSHHLQLCQCVAVAVFTDATTFTGVYDSSNGHWLEFTCSGLKEVGYLTDLRLNGENKRIHHTVQVHQHTKP